AIDDMLNQNALLFLQQMEGLSVYQINFLKAVAQGVHNNFTSQKILTEYHLGTKSNISRILSVLIQKELVEKSERGIVMADPVFRLWFLREWCM
ncbi:MAG: ATP-binding protein, partial [Bacteroidales bacterium]|nr:ATP-binding protein [Bacteroidales bacterium]